MSVEILIYTYLAICAGMIVFNIVTVVLSRHKRLRSFSASIRLELRIADEIDRLPAGGEVSPAHLRYIERKLRRADNMAAFDAAMERLCLRRPAAQVRAYLTALDGVFIAMAKRYCRRSVYAQSITDQGTGLMNRRAYEKYLCESENHGFASAVCIYIDANGLHEINNERGHERAISRQQDIPHRRGRIRCVSVGCTGAALPRAHGGDLRPLGCPGLQHILRSCRPQRGRRPARAGS